MSSCRDALVVVVTEATWGSALHALRSARQVGASTLAITVGAPDRVLAASRHCDRAVQLPADGGPERIGALIREVVESSHWPGPVVVVPLADRLAAALDFERHRFGENVQLSVPPHEALGPLLRKSSSLEAAIECGLAVPEFSVVVHAADIDAAARLRLPVIVRPDGPLDPSGGCGKAEVFRSRAVLEQRLTELVGRGARLVVQVQLSAPERAVEFGMCWRSRDGSAFAACTGRKRRQSHRDGGVMVWGETDRILEVAEFTRQFVEHVGFSGVGGAEFIRADGRVWFIEFNPRLEAIHFLATASGVDLLALEIEHCVTGATPSAPQQRSAAGWVGSGAFARLRAEPTMFLQLVQDRIEFARHPRHVRAVLDRDDFAPARELLRLLLSRLTARCLRRAGRPTESDAA